MAGNPSQVKAINMNRTEIVKKLENDKIDLVAVEKRINKGFSERVKLGKKQAKEFNWSEKRWLEWHDKLQIRKGRNLILARASIRSKNKTIDKIIKLLT